MTQLSSLELQQYARHLSLAEVGLAGQQKLKAASVLVVGAGGLGCPAMVYLAAAGIGTLGIVDADQVERSNLQRQILFSANDVGRPKVECAAQALHRLNEFVMMICHSERFAAENALALVSSFDVVIDATDNFTAKYLINDACFFAGKPLVFASISEFEGQLAVFNRLHANGERGPNLRDVYPVPPPTGFTKSCAEAGVLGVLPGILGGLQASETLKLILGLNGSSPDELHLFDAIDLSLTRARMHKRRDNPLSGESPTLRELIPLTHACALPMRPEEVSYSFIEDCRKRNHPLRVIDVREPHEREMCSIDGDLIPLATLAQRLGEIDPDVDAVVYCKSGGRSLRAVALLRPHMRRGRCFSLAGGMDYYQSQQTKLYRA